jgi:peptidoglycan/LPS O-acetylase OafA/YrhL
LYIPTLDGWRAISIAFVIVSHVLVQSPLMISLGPLGVSIFFSISGYLICTLLLQERARTGAISLRGFYIRRIFRILPPAMTYLAVMLVAGAAGLPDVLRCLFFAANYWEPHTFYLAHFWSLSMEEHFYLFWPTVLAFLGNRRAAVFAGAGVVVVLGWREWALIHAPGAIFYHRTDTRLDAFFAPCLLAILLQQSPAWRRRLQRWLSPPALVGLVGLLAGFYFLSRGSDHIEAIQKTVQSLVIPLIVTGTVLNPQTWIGRLLELAPLRFVGRISYSLYLWQEMALMALLHSALWLRLGVALAAAMVSYYAIEQPFIRLGARFRKRLLDSATLPSPSGQPFIVR